MCGRTLKLMSVLVMVGFIVMGCSGSKTVSKVNSGKEVEVFFSKSDIQKEYTVVSQATGSCSSDFGRHQVEKTLIDKAKAKGADAVLITEVDLSGMSDLDAFNGINKMLKAMYLKYDKAGTGTGYSRN